MLKAPLFGSQFSDDFSPATSTTVTPSAVVVGKGMPPALLETGQLIHDLPVSIAIAQTTQKLIPPPPAPADRRAWNPFEPARHAFSVGGQSTAIVVPVPPPPPGSEWFTSGPLEDRARYEKLTADLSAGEKDEMDREEAALRRDSDTDSIGSASDLRCRADPDIAADLASGQLEQGDAATVSGTVTSSVYHAECESIAADQEHQLKAKAPGGGGRRRARVAAPRRSAKRQVGRDPLIGHEYGDRPLLDDDDEPSSPEDRDLCQSRERHANSIDNGGGVSDDDIFAAAPFPRRRPREVRTGRDRAAFDSRSKPPQPQMAVLTNGAPRSEVEALISPSFADLHLVQTRAESRPESATSDMPAEIGIPAAVSERVVLEVLRTEATTVTEAAQKQGIGTSPLILTKANVRQNDVRLNTNLQMPKTVPPRPVNPFFDMGHANQRVTMPAVTNQEPSVRTMVTHVPERSLPASQTARAPLPTRTTARPASATFQIQATVPAANFLGAGHTSRAVAAPNVGSMGAGLPAAPAPKASTLPRLGQPSYSQFINVEVGDGQQPWRPSQLARLFASPPGKHQAATAEASHSDDETRLRKKGSSAKYHALSNDGPAASVSPSRVRLRRHKCRAADDEITAVSGNISGDSDAGFANLSFENQCGDEDGDFDERLGFMQSVAGLGSFRKTGSGLFSKLK